MVVVVRVFSVAWWCWWWGFRFPYAPFAHASHKIAQLLCTYICVSTNAWSLTSAYAPTCTRLLTHAHTHRHGFKHASWRQWCLRDKYLCGGVTQRRRRQPAKISRCVLDNCSEASRTQHQVIAHSITHTMYNYLQAMGLGFKAQVAKSPAAVAARCNLIVTTTSVGWVTLS